MTKANSEYVIQVNEAECTLTIRHRVRPNFATNDPLDRLPANTYQSVVDAGGDSSLTYDFTESVLV